MYLIKFTYSFPTMYMYSMCSIKDSLLLYMALRNCVFSLGFLFSLLHVRVHLDLVAFTDEEGYGKYVDLHEVYDKFLNLRGVEV